MTPPDNALAASNSSDFLLVVLGPPDQVPQGLQLGDSRLTLGAGEQDDVFLTGVGVVPAHLKLIFVEGRVTLLSATEEVRIDGLPVPGYPVELQPLQALSLSPDTHLAYGPAGSSWPLPPPWLLPLPEQQAAPAQPAAAAAAAPAAATRAMSAPRTVRQHMAFSAKLGAVAAAVALVIVGGLLLSDEVWGQREVVHPGEVAIDHTDDMLRKLLASDPSSFGSIRLVERPDGALALTGFVDSEAAYRKLAELVRQQVGPSGGNVRLDAMTSERLSALLRDQLARFPLGSRVAVTPTQVKVTVFGLQIEPEAGERLKTDLGRLAVRVAPRKLEFDYQLQPAERFASEIGAALAAGSTTRDLQFTTDEQGGRISGLVAVAVEAEARAALDELQKAYADRLPLVVDLKVDPKLNFSVVSLALGGQVSTATLMQRGKTQNFRIGEAVFGAGELADIKPDGVVLALGRREIFIPLIR